MEKHAMQRLPALFFDNLQKSLNKLVWKHMKFYTMTHYTTSPTAHKIFPMNCQNTSLKYKKEFKQVVHASFIGKDANSSSNDRESFLTIGT